MVFVKGEAKIKGSGKKKGTLNKVTQILLSMETEEAIMKMLAEQAILNKSINAARIWLEQYNSSVGTVLDTRLDTLEDIKNTGALVTGMMLRNELNLARGAKVHDALTKQKSYIEGELEPVLTKMLNDEIELAKSGQRK